MGTRLVQDIYRCDTCVCAADIHGRCCRHGLLYPVMLLVEGEKECPDYKLDAEKIKKAMIKQDKEL